MPLMGTGWDRVLESSTLPHLGFRFHARRLQISHTHHARSREAIRVLVVPTWNELPYFVPRN